MQSWNPLLIPLGIVMMAALAGAVIAVGRALLAPRRARRRVVEKPNSYYSAPVVEQIATRERWDNIALDRLHPVNREEVERLLSRMRADRHYQPAPRDREFLERMARISGIADNDPPH